MQWRFGPFRLNLEDACLWHGAQRVPLRPKTFALLVYLVTHAGELVSRAALFEAVWPETSVTDGVLTTSIGELRQVLLERATHLQCITTVHRRGYRFVAPVTVEPPPEMDMGRPTAPTTPLPAAAPPEHAAAVAAPALVSPAPPSMVSPAQDITRGLDADGQERPDAERRQLTVLFCGLVGATALAGQLDPEDLHEVMRAYLGTCTAVIARFGGNIDTFLGDGVLVCFGYPQAHDDDPQRAVRAGLGIVEAMGHLNTHLQQTWGVQLAARLGIHTGLVVGGALGVAGTRDVQTIVGEAPTIAARLQELGAPNTVVCSAATAQLADGYFVLQALGPQRLKGVATPVPMYRVMGESTARTRFDLAVTRGLTPLVGREPEVALLLERWAQVKEGVGQVVLLSGEAGIGKSRLVQVLKEQVAAEPQAWLTPCQCSPYYQNTALYPWIELLERVVLQFGREESSLQKLGKLEGFLVQYGLPLAEAVPLFAALLSLPLPVDYTPLQVSPEQQKQRTLHALLTILLRIAAQQPVLLVMEDLHWVDPSTLELLSLLVNQGPTDRILALFTFRPDFSPPWTGRAHLAQVTVPRLPRRQAVEVIRRVAYGKALPTEVIEQIVAKTDGVPLFVEELTKMVLDSGLLQERDDCYALTGPLPALAIPATLHDSLMARLDRLATVKAIAQLGATLGREFSYELMQAVSPWDDEALQRGLHQLVEAEFLYQLGLPSQATYLFKHTLIQEAAYQSLLRSTRQQHHQRIAQVLAVQFPDTVATQPELLAHHYTEAGLNAQAVPYWQRAGQRAIERSAHVEAVAHLTQGLDMLMTLPETREHARHELALRHALGTALSVTKGWPAPEVGKAYGRAQHLCQQLGETAQLFPVLWGLGTFHFVRGEPQTARELGAQLLALAPQHQEPTYFLTAHFMLGCALTALGALEPALTHWEQTFALYDPQQHHALTHLFGVDPGVLIPAFASHTLWLRGYPDQALMRSRQALDLAQHLSHPFSLAIAHCYAAMLHQFRREPHLIQQQAEAAMTICTEQGFTYYLAWATFMQGWALTVQSAERADEDALAQLRQGFAELLATGAGCRETYYRALLAEVGWSRGDSNTGQQLLAEAFAVVQRTEERYWEAELYRLHGKLLGQEAERPQREDAEAHFLRALEVARNQQAKSLELRAATSLARLRQQQGKCQEARELLAPIYGWFTEGFDTVDFQESQALLEEL